VSIICESETEEAFQFLSSLRGEHNKIMSKDLFRFPKVLMTKDELVGFLDLSKYKNTEVLTINRPILLGKSLSGQKIEISMDRVEEHLKIEGMTRSGKSGVMINIVSELLEKDKRVLLLDPHNSTTDEIMNRADKIDNVVTLSIRNRADDLYLGMNPLLCFGDMRERDERISSLVYAFFAQESEAKQLATLESGRVLLAAGVQFNYEFLLLLKEKGLSEVKIVEIMKEKQLTLNDLKRYDSDEKLRQLINTVIRKNYPAIARSILDPKQFNSSGLSASLVRLKDATSDTGEIFFESRGFKPLSYLQENKSVFCYLQEIKPLSRGIVNRLIFGGLAELHKQRVIKGKTYFMVDEAASCRIPNLLEIVTESNKFDLHLMLAYQSSDMWSGIDTQEAIRLIPNLLEFDLPYSPKQKREFEAKTRDYRGNPPRGFTHDYEPKKRDYRLPKSGETYELVKKRINLKEYDIYDYFLNGLV
jgi:hypothetical protein